MMHFLPKYKWASYYKGNYQEGLVVQLCGARDSLATIHPHLVDCYKCKSYQEYKEAILELEIGYDGNKRVYEAALINEYIRTVQGK